MDNPNELLTQQEPAAEPFDDETLRAFESALAKPGRVVQFTNSKGESCTTIVYGKREN